MFINVATLSICFHRRSIREATLSIIVHRLSVSVARLSINVATLSYSVPRLSISVARLSISVATLSYSVPGLSISVARLSISVATLGMQRYAHFTIRYVSRYRGHDTIRIAIHHKLFALLGNFVSGLQSVNHITETWVVSNTEWPKIFSHKHPY